MYIHSFLYTYYLYFIYILNVVIFCILSPDNTNFNLQDISDDLLLDSIM